MGKDEGNEGKERLLEEVKEGKKVEKVRGEEEKCRTGGVGRGKEKKWREQ